MKRLFTQKALIRSLQVFAGIAAIYFAIALALVFWPAPEPFAGPGIAEANSPIETPDSGFEPTAPTGVEEISIEARDGESIFARRYAGESSTSIILMHGIANDSSAFEPAQRVIVAGHSMGGGVAMRYALKDGAPVPDAYLLFAPNFGEGPTQRSPEDGEDTSAFVHFDVRRMIGIIMLNTVAIHALDDLPILYFNIATQRMDYSYRAVMSAQPIRPETSDIALQAVQSPLLVIVGADDEVFEVGQFEPFISANSDGETVILPGLTHDGIVNDAATYEVVLEWYNSRYSANE